MHDFLSLSLSLSLLQRALLMNNYLPAFLLSSSSTSPLGTDFTRVLPFPLIPPFFISCCTGANSMRDLPMLPRTSTMCSILPWSNHPSDFRRPSEIDPRMAEASLPEEGGRTQRADSFYVDIDFYALHDLPESCYESPKTEAQWARTTPASCGNTQGALIYDLAELIYEDCGDADDFFNVLNNAPRVGDKPKKLKNCEAADNIIERNYQTQPGRGSNKKNDLCSLPNLPGEHLERINDSKDMPAGTTEGIDTGRDCLHLVKSPLPLEKRSLGSTHSWTPNPCCSPLTKRPERAPCISCENIYTPAPDSRNLCNRCKSRDAHPPLDEDGYIAPCQALAEAK